jgi:hypothetical protein
MQTQKKKIQTDRNWDAERANTGLSLNMARVHMVRTERSIVMNWVQLAAQVRHATHHEIFQNREISEIS